MQSKNLALLSSLLLTSLSSHAALAPESGFSGEVNFLTGYYSDKNNLSTNNDAYQKDITSSAESKEETHDSVDGDGIFGLLGIVNYTFGEELNHQLFLGTSREEIATGSLAFELGYKYQFNDGTVVSFSALPTLVSAEVWADPYAVGEQRNETDLTGNAGRIKIDRLMGSNFGIDIGAGFSEIEDEHSGSDAQNGIEDVTSFDGDALTQEEVEQLKRDRQYYSVKVDYLYVIPEGRGLLLPSLTLASSDADGSALSYQSIKGELSYAKSVKRHSYALTLDARVREYDTVNPLYGKTREDKQYGMFLAYEYANVFGAKNWSFVSLLGANIIDSNIDYYDADFFFASVGANYKF
ncbi:DUF2860 family protein [Vibrio coralliirubri]|uniref:DUF2860 family protein n=1 Tax=Vibrio coralliirubri TaxID=1516159 RepID=UPI000B34B624|nr:DUF2860 family protein [Vibrio coralliirubri]